MQRILIPVLLSLVLANAGAQDSQLYRYELFKPGRDLHVLNLKEDGLMLWETAPSGRRSIAWHLLDTALRPVYTDTVKLETDATQLRVAYSARKHEVGFFIQNTFHTATFLFLNTHSGKTQKHEVKITQGQKWLPQVLLPVNGEWILASERNYRPVLYRFHPDSGIRKLPFTWPDADVVLDAAMTWDEQDFLLLYKLDAYSQKGRHAFTILGMDGQAQIPVQYAGNYDQNKPYRWQNIFYTRTGTGQYTVCGIWDHLRLRNTPQGYFWGRYEAGKTEELQYTEFTTLERFYAWMGPVPENRMQKKREKKQRKEKELMWNGPVVMGETTFWPGRTLMHFDFFRVIQDPPNNAWEMDRQTRNAWRSVIPEYSHSLVCALDSTGKIEEHITIPLTITERISEPNRVSVAFTDSLSHCIRLLYPWRNAVYSYRLHDGNLTANCTIMERGASHEVPKSDPLKAMYWRKNRYIVNGYQRVKTAPGQAFRRWVYAITAFQ
ncbi:MAG: hypothetical protein JNL57_03050 [Bacteroidetes bacterium]|nr:hypothetical protein [Bacteroidota bacterium]